MEQSGFLSTQAGNNILRRRKVQTLLITLPATLLAAVGVIVLIPAIAWINDLSGSAEYASYYLCSDYLFIASMVMYFPVHMVTAVYGHWIIEMISTFLGCLAICSGGGTLYHYGLGITHIYAEHTSEYPYDDTELVHYNLGFAGSFLSMIAVVASLTMMPTLKKFRERSSGVSYTRLPVMDNDERYATAPSVGTEAYPPHTHLPQPAAFSPGPGPMAQFVGHHPPTAPSGAAVPHSAVPPIQPTAFSPGPGPVAQFAGRYPLPSGAEVPHPAVPAIQPTDAPPSYSRADPQQQGVPGQELHAFPSTHQPEPVYTDN